MTNREKAHKIAEALFTDGLLRQHAIRLQLMHREGSVGEYPGSGWARKPAEDAIARVLYAIDEGEK